MRISHVLSSRIVAKTCLVARAFPLVLSSVGAVGSASWVICFSPFRLEHERQK